MQLRRERHEEIETLLKTNVLEKHRYYVTAVMETIQFLAINELPLRGDKDGGYEFHPTEQDTIEDNIPSGLFMRHGRLPDSWERCEGDAMTPDDGVRYHSIAA